MAALSHPFGGRDIGQLMERILAGRYKPLDPKCFSADFRGQPRYSARAMHHMAVF